MSGESTNGALVRRVLDERKITVVFQPLVELSETPRVFAYETLVRSQVEEFPSPPALINAAVENGCIGELGRLIREMAIETCADYPLFLNIDPSEFDQGWLVRPDDPAFSHTQDVFLEITESVPLSHHRHCHGVLNEIRRRGLNLAVDDLGAGYSNLKYIADLAPEIVKLDRELVKDLRSGSRLHMLVTAIVNMCNAMGARVVAEGIETVKEYVAVREAGVHYGQGWYMARPASPPPEIDAEAIKKEARAEADA